MGSSTHNRPATLRQLIDADCYVVVAADIAEAIVMRCVTRLTVAGRDVPQRPSPGARAPVRSFRLDERVPSFRACGPRARVHSRR